MSRKGLFTQTTREAPAASMRESVIAPTVLPVCCLCRKVRDETRSSPDREHWVTQRMYRQSHGINPADVPLTHTYCLKCFTKVQNTLRGYQLWIRTSP
jgi:hypothetical protein